jgi:hypothetical protein
MSRGHLAAALIAATLALAVPSAAQADSFPLVGWWPMNDGSGQTVRDWSGRGNSGTLGSTSAVEGSDPTWIKGVFAGSALRFDGDDFVTIPGTAALEPARLTVAAWVRGTTSPGAFKYVMSKGSLTCLNSSYGLYTGSGGGLAFYIADGPGHFFKTPEAPPTVWDGQWHNVAGTFDGATVRLYVDGVQVGSGTPAPTTINYDLGADGGQIGGYPGTCTDALTLVGDIDGVQVWSQALPVDTIWRTLKLLFTTSR